MTVTVNRRCPRCGRRAHNDLLVQCPDCRVPFVLDEQTSNEVTPDMVRLVVAQILGSWKFWAMLAGVIGLAAWGVVAAANKVIEARSRQYLDTFGEQASNHIGLAFSQMSNQITLQFKQPRIKAVMEQVARDRANEIFSNNVRPTIEAFQDAMDQVNAQIARSTNDIADLQAQIEAAKHRIPPPLPATATNPVVPTQPTNSVVEAAPALTLSPPAAPDSIVKLTMINHVVTQAGTTYTLTIQFRVTGSITSGPVEVMAGTYKLSAKILNFAAMTTGPVEAATYDDAADIGKLRFLVSERETPTLILEFSAPTIVRLISDSLDNDLTLPVAADKMQVPAAAK